MADTLCDMARELRDMGRDMEPEPDAAEAFRSLFTPFNFGDVTVCHEQPGRVHGASTEREGERT